MVLVGHSGAGKTSLSGDAAGRHRDDSAGRQRHRRQPRSATTTPPSTRQQRSVSLALAPLISGEVKVNLIDTPGYADFVGELRAGLRAADAALFVVSACDPIDGATRMLWHECAAVDMPRAIVVTKLDQPRADFRATLAACQEVFGDGVLRARRAGARAALIGSADAAGEDRGTRGGKRSALIEGIIAESEDETLMDSYLGGTPWTQDAAWPTWRRPSRAVPSSRCSPVGRSRARRRPN